MLPAPRNSGTAKWGSAIAERILKCTFQKKMDVKKREVAKRVAKGGRHAQADVLGTAEIVGARRCAPDRSGVFRACLVFQIPERRPRPGRDFRFQKTDFKGAGQIPQVSDFRFQIPQRSRPMWHLDFRFQNAEFRYQAPRYIG